MNVNAAQIQSIQRTWRAVCKDRKWQAADREFRLATFSEILGRPVDSLTTVERIDECTKLMKSLQAMLGVSVQAGIEADDQTINRARVLRNKILTELIPCLEVYVEDVKGYLTSIMEDKNRWWKIDRPVRDITLMDLDAKPIRKWDVKSGGMKDFPSQLDQLVYTLSSCLNGSGKVRAGKKSRLGFRVAAGDTLHEMKMKAGVPCDCGACARPMLAHSHPAAESPITREGVPF